MRNLLKIVLGTLLVLWLTPTGYIIYKRLVPGDLPVEHAQQILERISGGCTTGGTNPRGVAKSFWLSSDLWLEFELSDTELACIQEKKGVIECACDASSGSLGNPPRWFKPKGKPFTLRRGDDFRLPCIWQSSNGPQKYLLADSEAFSCRSDSKEFLMERGASPYEWLRVEASAPEKPLEAGEDFSISFSFMNEGIVPVTVNIPLAKACRQKEWTVPASCRFTLTPSPSPCNGDESIAQVVLPGQKFEYTLPARVLPDVAKGGYGCGLETKISNAAKKGVTYNKHTNMVMLDIGGWRSHSPK